MKSGNGRIAKNTLALYFRMVVTVLVSLYTSRIVLDALGASDFGLYSVVGGVVLLLSFLNTTMVTATQRFLNFEKGAGDPARLRRVFSTSLLIHLILAGVILVVAESAGLWLLNTQLNIEAGRVDAANWVYQCAILAFLVTTVTAPFNAAIIANERMTAFAYVSLLDVGLKLTAAYLLQLVGPDKLKAYAVLMLVASATVGMVYMAYARRQFVECRVGPRKDPALFREMLSFSSWTVISNFSVILRTQGIAIVLNLFFGTLVNAALGIAMQVNMALRSFSANFTQALNPQIVKSYAAGDLERTHVLVLTGCRLSFFLVLLFSLPALIEAEAILHLWLTDVPPHTTAFVRLILIQSLVESFAGVLGAAQGATGNVKRYHLTLSTIGLMNIPASYLLLKAGFEPYAVLGVAIVFSSLIGAVRVLFLRKSIALPMDAFLTTVLVRCLLVGLLSPIVPLLMHVLMDASLLSSLAVCVTAGFSVLVAVALVGMSGSERKLLARLVSGRLGFNR